MGTRKERMSIFVTAIQHSTESNGFCSTVFIYFNPQAKASGLIMPHFLRLGVLVKLLPSLYLRTQKYWNCPVRRKTIIITTLCVLLD